MGEIRPNTHYVPDGANSKENNLVTVMSVLRNVYVRRRNLELVTPSALMIQSAVCGVRLRKGKQQGNVRENITGTVSVNRPQRKKITKLSNQTPTFQRLKYNVP